MRRLSIFFVVVMLIASVSVNAQEYKKSTVKGITNAFISTLMQGELKGTLQFFDPDYVDWVVSVNLQIEQERKMFVLSRQFIPEVKTISYKDLPALISQMKSRRSQLAGSADYVAADDMIARIQQYYDAIVESVNF